MANAELHKISEDIPSASPTRTFGQGTKVNHREDQAASQEVPKDKFISTCTEMIRGCVRVDV